MVQITGNFAAGEDVLGFLVNGVFTATYNQNGISGSYTPSTGILNLTGTASLAAYNAGAPVGRLPGHQHQPVVAGPHRDVHRQ